MNNRSIDDILNNHEYSIFDKIEELKKMEKEIDNEVSELYNKVKYCKYCNKYYLKESWKEKHKKEVKRVCSYWSFLPEEEDDIEYEKRLCDVKYKVCPCRHEIEVSRTIID